MPESINLTVLARCLDGNASAEERATLEAWIGADLRRRAVIAELHAAWTAEARRLGAPYDAETAWTRVAQRVQRGDAWETAAHLVADPGGPSRRPRGVRRWEPLWVAPKLGAWAAAAAVVVATAGAAWLTLGGRQPPSVAQVPAMREYATTRGQRAIVRLLDGTDVTLNVASRLRVPAAFGATRREVYLDGEAYFSVIHDSLRPFTVRTTHGVTRDIGTKFGVHAYPDEATERIAVAEGAVSVAATAPDGVGAQQPRGGDSGSDAVQRPTVDVPLHAGQVVTLSRAGRVSVVRAANVASELAWIGGRLEFEGVPLGDVARRLGRWYDLDVRITTPGLARRPVTGSYGNEPIAHVLTVITAAVGARYQWRGRTVTISIANRTP